MTYQFFTFAGVYLDTIETDDPAAETGEISAQYGVDADEIEWQEDDGHTY